MSSPRVLTQLNELDPDPAKAVKALTNDPPISTEASCAVFFSRSIEP